MERSYGQALLWRWRGTYRLGGRWRASGVPRIKLQEDVLQRRFLHVETPDGVARKDLDHRVNAARELEVIGATRLPLDFLDAGNRTQLLLRGAIGELNDHHLAGAFPQPLDLLDRHQFAGPYHGDALTGVLDLAEDVRAHEGGQAVLGLVQQKLVEGALAQRIQSTRRLIQNRQLRRTHERLDDSDHLAHPFGKALELPVERHLEALEQRGEEDRLQAGHM